MIIYFQADPGMVFSEIVATQINGVVAGTSTSVTSQVSNPCLYAATFTDLPQGMLSLYGEASDGRGYYGSVVIGDEATIFADQSAASVDAKLTAERLAKIDLIGAEVVTALKNDAEYGTSGLLAQVKATKQFLINKRTNEQGNPDRITVYEDNGVTEAFQLDFDPTTGDITPVDSISS